LHVVDPEVAGSLVQFGTAGLIGWMWLSERRGAMERERQLRESHERIVQERTTTEALLACVRENTRVLAQIEAGQRSLLTALAGERASMQRAG
jgi:hypothetical protein